MSDFSDDIKRYLDGEMTPVERHALEKKALSDPFLADALEGSEQISTTDFSGDIASLHTLIDQRVKQNAGGNPFWTWGLRLAAGLLLITITTFILWNALDEKPTAPQQSSAEKNETETPSSSPTDSVVLDNTKDRLALADRPRASEPTRSVTSTRKEPVTVNEKALLEAEQVAEEVSEPVPLSEAKSIAGGVSKDATEETIVEAEAKKEVAGLDDAARAEGPVQRSAKKTLSPSAPQLSNAVRGKVTSAEDGSPLPGVNVIIKGTTIGTVTDVTGSYFLGNTSPSTTLVYSFIGLQSKEVPIENKNNLDVEMNLDVSQLSEVVVIGYGYSEKNETTSTVDLAHPGIGTRAYKKYLEENLRYPQPALDAKVEGRVTVEFFVETGGGLNDFTIVKGIGSGCDEELIRLIKEGPAWIATKKDGVAVRDKAKIRLKFSLPKD